MNIASSGASVQIATQRAQFAQSQIKQNAQADKQIADIITQAAQAGSQAASSKKVDIVV